MATLVTIFAVWLLLAIALTPVIGGRLRRNRRSQSMRLPPLPSGSIHDRDGLTS